MNEREMLEALDEVLLRGENLLAAVSDETYSRHVPSAYNASLGGHYRHCIEHFRSVLDSEESDEIDYDLRPRDVLLETCRTAAIAETTRLRERTNAIPPEALCRPVRIRHSVSYANSHSPAAESTVGREILFCISHAIHHYALMGIICGALEVDLPPDFGIAPSTVRHYAAAVSA